MKMATCCAAMAVVLTLAVASHAADDKASKQKTVERGKYLVDFGGCHDCHSPKVFTPEGPVPDTSKLLSGHPAGSEIPAIDKQALNPGYWVLLSPDFTAFVGPWGVAYTANLTPDDQTGIGLWTEEIFIQALRTGKHMGNGRPILPPMAWPALAGLTDDDLKAIFAYLKSLPPVKNPVPAPVAAADVK